jgi:hypothetical protein
MSIDRLKNGERVLYVRGIVRYDDGFVKDRFTKFCLRYDRRGYTEDYIIGADGRRSALIGIISVFVIANPFIKDPAVFIEPPCQIRHNASHADGRNRHNR